MDILTPEIGKNCSMFIMAMFMVTVMNRTVAEIMEESHLSKSKMPVVAVVPKTSDNANDTPAGVVDIGASKSPDVTTRRRVPEQDHSQVSQT